MTGGEKPLAGKVALVTGGGRGIGRAIAERLAGDGAFVIVNFRADRAAAEGVVAGIEAAGARAYAIQGDIGAIASIRTLLREAGAYLTATLGSDRIDILVNNAGVAWPHGLDTPEADYDRIMAVNLKAPLFMALETVSRMPDGGRIINISSTSAKVAEPSAPLYSVAKHGLTGVTRNLALALGPRSICVNGVEPGTTMTDMTARFAAAPGSGDAPVTPGRAGKPSDIADVVAFLASDEARWVTGQSFGVDGGEQL